MTEKLGTEQKGFKVWRNPAGPKDPIAYLGEFYPPGDQGFMTGSDLKELGFGIGSYSILAPPSARHAGFIYKWQKVVISK